MRLAAVTGAYVDLQVVGYQFPDLGQDSNEWDEWDANWLLIRWRPVQPMASRGPSRIRR